MVKITSAMRSPNLANGRFHLVWNASSYKPDADALVNSAEGLKDEEAGIFNKVLKASNQEEVIHKNLRDREYFT